jgi:2-phospho-L-lactate guanylyltransferase (CobY/MobA/RfbA family)
MRKFTPAGQSRQQKEAALMRVFQGDQQAAQQLRPKLTLDLDQLSGYELEALLSLCPLNESTGMLQADLPLLEQTFGHSLKLIPLTIYQTL